MLENGLKTNFAEASVEIVDCPDLSQAPYFLAGSGLGGDPTIVEYGGPPYLIPLPDKSKVYDLVPLMRKVSGYESKEFFACGAGAGAWPIFDQNCEGILNLKVGSDGTLTNESHVSRTVPGGTELTKVPPNETRCALLGNL